MVTELHPSVGGERFGPEVAQGSVAFDWECRRLDNIFSRRHAIENQKRKARSLVSSGSSVVGVVACECLIGRSHKIERCFMAHRWFRKWRRGTATDDQNEA